MKNRFTIISVFLYIWIFNAQNNSTPDDKYREDQFYASITYNLLSNRPSGISQNGFSPGLHLGFIRDMPINKERDLAIGLGLGLSINSYNQSLLIDEENGVLNFNNTDLLDENVTINRFSNYLVEVPLEFRWRTSTAIDYNFWRVYLGFKLGYLLYDNSRFESNLRQVNLSNISHFNNFQYGLTLNAGYGTWNFHLYYGLNPIFNSDALLNNSSIDLKVIKIGIMFYVL